jgi:hypothetical protein
MVCKMLNSLVRVLTPIDDPAAIIMLKVKIKEMTIPILERDESNTHIGHRRLRDERSR